MPLTENAFCASASVLLVLLFNTTARRCNAQLGTVTQHASQILQEIQCVLKNSPFCERGVPLDFSYPPLPFTPYPSMFTCSKIRSCSREVRRRRRSDFVEVIENPVLNSPYKEPARHFRFSDEGITSEIVESRRASSYFIPIPKPKKKGSQLIFDTE